MESNPHIAQEIRRLEEQYAFRPDSLVFGRLADLHRKAGNPGRALDILEEGLRRHPRYLSAHIVRARCFRALGRDEEARQAFREVLELDAQNLVALRSLAEMALESGAPEEAREHLEALLRVDPGSDEARRMLAETEVELRRADEERSQDEDPAVEDPPREEGGDGRPSAEVAAAPPAAAASEEEVEELREQVEELDLEEPAEADGDGEMATRTLAGLYETQGFYREAVEMYERLLEERPGPEAEEIRERLERARAALSESGGRGCTVTSDEGAAAPAEATAAAPSARAQLRAVVRGEAAGEDLREGVAEPRGREGTGAHA